jgi:hypothetical protein
MNRPLLERRSPLGISYALLILTVFFFLIPSAFRAARLSLGQKENDVKNWLPSDFPETAELNWLKDHFVSESFVLATWPGCSSGDKRLRLLEQKLLYESESYDPSSGAPDELKETYRRARQVGQELQLLQTGDDYRNWGGLDEKWLCSPQGQWYYITPDGSLYRWDEPNNAPAAGIRSARRSMGWFELTGQLVTAFGDQPISKVANPFFNDPSLLCAPLFETVQTGDSVVAELAVEDGPLWPIDLTDEERRETVAKRLAMSRMTGTLFAPAVPKDFSWTAEAFRAALPQNQRDQLPETFDDAVQSKLDQIIADQFEGSISQLQSASTADQAKTWYAVFDAAEVTAPPRTTCVLLTLTDVGKNNLPFAIGRGVLGGPQGRLLQLAEQSGVQPAPPPSMAPPPFDRQPATALAGMPPLRLGGPPVDNVAIDEEGSVTLVRLVGYSVLLGIVLSYLCFRSVKITVMIFVVGGSSAMLSMAMVWWTGGTVDAILMSMPSLVYVLGLSGAIHVVNYYRDEVRTRGASGAAGRALLHAAVPCALASLTTAIGLISLFTSNLAPISNFGLYSAIGVMSTLGILFSYLPSALETFRPAFEAVESSQPAGREESQLAQHWASAGRWITGHHVLVSTVCLAALVGASVGLFNIRTSVQLLKLFDSQSRIIEDYAWMEDHFGKLVPMELVLRVPPQMLAENRTPGQPATADEPLEMLERVEAVSRIGKVVRRTLGEPGLDIVGQTMSAETFLPPLPAPSNGYDWTGTRSKYNRGLMEGRADLLASDYLQTEQAGPYSESELWRISLRVGALSDVDYGQFITTLRTAVEPVMRAYDTRGELLRQLATDDNGNPAQISGKQRVLIVGSKRPATLDEIELVSRQTREIDTGNIFLATLGELLAGERVKSPGWLDPAAEQKLTVGSESWNGLIAAFDAVVWVGGEGVRQEDLAAAKRLIDGRAILSKSVRPSLVDGRFPDVEGSGPLQVVYTGVIPVVYKAQRTLLHSLANSIGLAFVLIAFVMIVLLNPGSTLFERLRPSNLGNALGAGMVSMIPNVFPVLIVFGVMCHRGIEIDIGTMMTASVAMGVAVDDTIHFLTWFRANLDRGLNRVDAVIETYRRVGPAMTQTTIVGGLGLFVFALSTFTPTQRFGTLMLVMLATALVGDLVLFPALLAGPAGRWFKPRDTRHVRDDEDLVAPDIELQVAAAPEESDPIVETVDPEREIDKEALPHLRVHYPADRPPARRLK